MIRASLLTLVGLGVIAIAWLDHEHVSWTIWALIISTGILSALADLWNKALD